MKKVVVALCLVIGLITIFAQSAFAVDLKDLDTTPWSQNVPTGTVKSVGGQMLAIMQVVGVSIAAVMLIALAIKYLMSAPNERAEIKKHMAPYLIGAIFIFGAANVVGILKDFTDGII